MVGENGRKVLLPGNLEFKGFSEDQRKSTQSVGIDSLLCLDRSIKISRRSWRAASTVIVRGCFAVIGAWAMPNMSRCSEDLRSGNFTFWTRCFSHDCESQVKNSFC